MSQVGGAMAQVEALTERIVTVFVEMCEKIPNSKPRVSKVCF